MDSQDTYGEPVSKPLQQSQPLKEESRQLTGKERQDLRIGLILIGEQGRMQLAEFIRLKRAKRGMK